MSQSASTPEISDKDGAVQAQHTLAIQDKSSTIDARCRGHSHTSKVKPALNLFTTLSSADAGDS